MPQTLVSHDVVVEFTAGAVVSSEASTRKDLLPRFLSWLLVEFSSSRVVGLEGLCSLLAVDWRPLLIPGERLHMSAHNKAAGFAQIKQIEE